MTVSIASIPLSPPVLLAPMAGITDRPFRDLVQSFGAGLVVSEMVASQEMVQARPGTRARAELGAAVARTAVQLAGREAYWMAEAARRIEDMGAAVIDINMGCPAKRVTNGASGSALMKTPDHALRLIEAVVGAVGIPVTLKTRLGWDSTLLNAPELARRAESAGVRLITIHGRTRCQFYKGRADWAAIRAVKLAVRVPVIANGDILGPQSAARALARSNADGVMVGRAARGRPWLLADIAHRLYGADRPTVPKGRALVETIGGHYRAMLGFYGRDLGLRVARKHLGWYLDAAGAAPTLRRRILTAQRPRDVLALLPDAIEGGDPVRAEAAA